MQEFKAHLAKYVNQAQQGETIELTSHRKVVAHLNGVPQTENDNIARLLATGAVSWQGGKPKGAAFTLNEGGKAVSTMVLEDRE